MKKLFSPGSEGLFETNASRENPLSYQLAGIFETILSVMELAMQEKIKKGVRSWCSP